MNSIENLSNFTTIQIVWHLLIVDIILTAVCAYILKWFYIRFGKSLSNRAHLAANFVAIAVTTALVITIVKSSLALSLGLVGALSIVRFRTAIKDPEELAYLFLSIALGLGFGAGQRLITILAFLVILSVMWLQHRLDRNNQSKSNLYLIVNLNKKAESKKILQLISTHSSFFDLQRLEQQKNKLELAGMIEFNQPQQLDELINSLTKKYPTIETKFVDTTHLS